ncbi:hypothetical protein [Ruminococcus flavefaciens]|nr:hypothetical protein [Ruminococcus flavefaciens]
MEKFSELHGITISKDVRDVYEVSHGFGTGVQMKALENSMFWLVFSLLPL